MKSFVLVLFLIIINYQANAQTTITIDSTLQTSTCDGAQVIIWFKTTGSFALGNVFKAQLVSTTSFPPFLNPTIIDIGQSQGIALPPPFGDGVSKTATGNVPKGTPAGIYNVRLISTSPVDTSADYTCVSPIPIGGAPTNGVRCIVLTQNAQTTPPSITAKCENGNTVLTVNPTANSYLWSTGDTLQSTTVSKGGKYTVTTTDIIGCETETSTELPENVLKSECVGESTMLTCTLTANSYAWSTGQKGASIVVNDTSTNKAGVIYYIETSTPFSCAAAPTVYNSQCATFEMDIYPNPSKGIVNIRISRDFDTVNVNVMNSLGQIIYSETDKKTTPYYTTQLNLQGLSRGIYFIQLDTGKNKQTRKLLINY